MFSNSSDANNFHQFKFPFQDHHSYLGLMFLSSMREMGTSTQRILIVEDNKAMSSVLRFNIQKAGYEVFVANNGIEGLEIIRQHQIDFVITDYQMPQMGGYDFAVNMRQVPGYESVPLAMCSAKGFELNYDELFEKLHIIQLFYKPFSPREIVRFIDQTLSKTSVAAEEAGA